MPLTSLDGLPEGAQLHSSVAVVGAGPAGIALALELAARDVDVVLLEAGGHEFDPETQQRYAGDVVVDDHLDYPPLEVPRLRMFGGSTNHWGGWCRRLEANVFEPRPWLGDAAWPFGRAELEPGYRRAHELCELGRDVYDPELLADDLGWDAWRGLDRDGLESVLWRLSPPTRFGERYRADLEDSAVDVILGANVVSLEADGVRVGSITIVGEDRRVRTVDADAVVLATGGLESVRQLLLLNASGQVDVDASGWLGVGFAEHPHVMVGTVAIEENLAEDPNGPLALFRSVAPDVDDVLVRAGLAVAPDACADLGLPNMSFTVEPTAPGTTLGHLPSGPGVEGLMAMLDGGRAPVVHGLFMRSEQRVRRASRISLAEGRDDLGLRRIRLEWHVAPEDLAAASAGLELIASAFDRLGVAIVHDAGLVEPLTGVTGGAHHLGGARMHDDPEQGVVDADLRVHGTDNLYVCSSATFPTGGFSNPTLTIIALAQRLAGKLSS